MSKSKNKIIKPKKIGISQERIDALKPIFAKYVSFWRSYPDIFLDTITPEGSTFRLFFYQRLFLRISVRYRYVYATFTRAFSKSFLSILILYLKCIFYPGIKLFVASGGKEQAANIAKEKIQEIQEIWPALKNEVIEKQCLFSKDYVRVVFKNGSKLDIVAVRESTRGGRRHGGLIEEAILVDGQKLNEIVIPLMNVSRRARCGGVDPNENHKAQIFVTTAGYKDSYAYDKMVQLLIWQVIKGTAFVFGGDYRIPVMHKLLERNFVNELKEDGTFNEMSFAREYESTWSGSVENAFFNSENFDKHRVLKQPEHEMSGIATKDTYYVFGVDVARMGAQSVVMVIKNNPQAGGVGMKNLSNIYTYDDEHFEQQAVKIKRLYFKYKPKAIAIDANGLGVGLVDYLIKPSLDVETNEILPPFGVINDERYEKYITDDTIMVLHNVKANAEINSQMHVNVLSQMSSGRVRFLIDEKVAKIKLLNSKVGKAMSAEERAEYLKPFTLTSILKEEMMNLREKREGEKHISLEQVNRKIRKDKFSAFEYGLYYIKEEEDKIVKKKKKSRFADMMFYDTSKGRNYGKSRGGVYY